MPSSQELSLQPSYQNDKVLPLAESLDPEAARALAAWRERPDRTQSGAELLHLGDCAGVVLSRAGERLDLWPDAETVGVPEAVVREFLFPKGFCRRTELEPSLHAVYYRIDMLDQVEYLLICPYEDGQGELGGIVAVCLTRRRNLLRIAERHAAEDNAD